MGGGRDRDRDGDRERHLPRAADDGPERGQRRLVIIVWVVGGLLSLAGALTYAELAAAMPGAGGEYVYLTEAYGPVWGFLYGWTQMWVAKSGSIATLATAFFEYTGEFPSGNRSMCLFYSFTHRSWRFLP